MRPTIAILIPCHNEETAIADVVRDFRTAVPNASIIVCDNNSTDCTVKRAQAAGATVRSERLQGKGNVMRRMFADIDADVYVMVDGDNTYDAASAPAMIDRLLVESLDMVCAVRIPISDGVYRRGHRIGNTLLTRFVAYVFGGGVGDMLSGYRVLSRRFVKSFPTASTGFEIETELTVHALELRLPIAELPTPYRQRPTGSASKLRTYRDGARIFGSIFHLIKEEKPLEFFSGLFLVLGGTSIALVAPILITYYKTGLVPRIPTAILAASIMLLAFLSLVCGLILETVTRGRKEAKRMCYLLHPAASRFAKKLEH